ncbi:MAG: hypothetical protein ACRCYO_03625 [Bacteroidia bacterium]
MRTSAITLENIESYAVPLSEHPMKWIFEKEEGVAPSIEFQDQIIPLHADAAMFLWRFRMTQRMGVDEKNFLQTDSYSIVGKSSEEVKKWLYDRGIPFDQKVFWASQPKDAFVLTWKMVIKFWEDLFHGSDELIWDKTLNWVLEYDHNDLFSFGKNRIFNSETHSDEILKRNEFIQAVLSGKYGGG